MSLSKAQSADLGRSEHGAGPSSSSSQIRYAPTKQIPRASFFAIEYPGILAESSSTPSAQTQDGIGEPASVRSETSLDRALVTLAPQPAPYGTSASALAHIGTLVSHESKVLECRLPGHPLESSQSQLYRHPLLGDVVDTHNLVCRIRKRRWKRKRATAEDGSGASGGGTLQGKGKGRADAEAPGLRTGEVGQGAKGTTKPQEAREYTIEVLGVARKTARFRSMADYAFLPDVAPSAPESGSASQPSPSAPISPSPSIDLHSAMLRMDVSALRAFCFPRETEEYEIEKPSDSAEAETKISALRLIPPPFFSRTGQPFHYGFKQNPASDLVLAHRPDGTEVQRYLNRMRWRHLAPVYYKYEDTGPVPIHPNAEVEDMRERSSVVLLKRLNELFDERPVWTRLALLNQFGPQDQRTVLNQKQYIPLVAYAMNDGPWRDTLIKLGYDPRQRIQDRFYQRLYFRGRTNQAKSRGTFKAAYGGQLKDGATTGAGAGGDEEAEEADESAQVGSGDGNSHLSHIFDGTTLHRSVGNFQLCDITDPMLVSLIHAEGPENLRTEHRESTGWYTSQAWDRIRAIAGHKFHKLSTEGVAASTEECAELLASLGGPVGSASGSGGGREGGEGGGEGGDAGDAGQTGEAEGDGETGVDGGGDGPTARDVEEPRTEEMDVDVDGPSAGVVTGAGAGTGDEQSPRRKQKKDAGAPPAGKKKGRPRKEQRAS